MRNYSFVWLDALHIDAMLMFSNYHAPPQSAVSAIVC